MQYTAAMMGLARLRTHVRRTTMLTTVSLLVTMLIQIGVWVTIPHDAFWGVDSGAKFLQTLNFSLHNQAITYPGQVLDPPARFTPLISIFFFEHNQKFYGIYNVLFIALSALNYHLWGFDGLYLLPILGYFAILLLSVRLLTPIAPGWQPIIPLILGLGTPLLFYAMTFWEHTPGIACALASLLLLAKGQPANAARLWLFLAGVLAGLAFAFRTELGLWGLAMLLSALLIWPQRRLVLLFLFGAGMLLVTAGLQLYELLTFGTWLRRHIAVNYTDFHPFQNPSAWLSHQLALMDVMLLPKHQRLSWIALWGLNGVAVALSWRFHAPHFQQVLRAVVLVLLIGICALHIGDVWSPAKQGTEDLTQTVPLLALLPFVLVAPRRPFSPTERDWLRFLSGTVGFFLVGVTFTTFNQGGIQWGPRYLLVIVPVIIVIGVSYVAHLRWADLVGGERQIGMVLALILVMDSVGLQGYCVFDMREQILLQRKMVQIVAALPERVVAVNWNLTMMVLAPIFDDKLFFQVPPDQVTPFVASLHAQQVHEFAYVSLQITPAETKAPKPQNLAQKRKCCLELRKQRVAHFVRNVYERDFLLTYAIQHYAVK